MAAPSLKSGSPFQRYRDYLTQMGYKTTKQRDLIVKQFQKIKGHFTIDDLHSKVREIDQTIGTATVYRTMNLLKEAGIAAERQFKDSTPLYEVNLAEDHHDHLICIQCNQIVEFENQKIEDLQERVANDYGFKLTSHRMELYGICKNCQS